MNNNNNNNLDARDFRMITFLTKESKEIDFYTVDKYYTLSFIPKNNDDKEK